MLQAAVITISDKGSRGERKDTSGPRVCAMLEEAGYNIAYTAILPDDMKQIEEALIHCADTLRIPLVLTTGGTGFSPRDITPEATLHVIERETRGIPELMRHESLKVTPRACLSRAVAGIRAQTLIVNLPGSEKAAKENLQAVLPALTHGLEMLLSAGSADCAQPNPTKKEAPSIDEWLKEAKRAENAHKIGMYLAHNGVVRITPRAQVREGQVDAGTVKAMAFSYDQARVEAVLDEARQMEGILYVRAWLNEGLLETGDDIMRVLVGGDIRPHVVTALETLVGRLKSECVREEELF